MMYLGRITRVVNEKAYATISDLGGSHEFGPMWVVISIIPLTGTYTGETYLDGLGWHAHEVYSADMKTALKAGDLVLIGQLGHIKEDLVVIGRIDVQTGGCSVSNQ